MRKLNNSERCCMFVSATTYSNFPTQVQETNNTYDIGVGFPKGNICKGNFEDVVATSPLVFFNMLQHRNKGVDKNNSNVTPKTNPLNGFQANLQAQFHYTTESKPELKNKPNDRLRDQIQAFFSVQSAEDIQNDLHDLFQAYMASPTFNDADPDHRSNLFFTITQITTFFNAVEKEVMAK